MGLNDNKSPWAKNAAVDTTTAPSLDTFVDRKFATQYLAERLPMLYGTTRQFRDRIGKKIDTAVKNGELEGAFGQYCFEDLVIWARSRKDFAPAVADIEITIVGSVHAITPTLASNAFGYSLPPTLPLCQEALADAYRELNELRTENSSLRATVEALTPLKTKAIARSESARRSGKRAGAATRSDL